MVECVLGRMVECVLAQVYQTNFSVRVVLPADQSSPNAVLQLKYVSNNPDEIDPPTNTDAIFYNCADLYVAAAPNSPSPAALATISADKVTHVPANVVVFVPDDYDEFDHDCHCHNH